MHGVTVPRLAVMVWQTVADPATQRTYHFNPETNEKSWSPPDREQASAAPTPPTPSRGDMVWQTMVDPATQRTFYFNPETNEKSWSPPGRVSSDVSPWHNNNRSPTRSKCQCHALGWLNTA